MYFCKNLKIHTDHFPRGINLQVFRIDKQSVLFEVLTWIYVGVSFRPTLNFQGRTIA